MKNYQKKFICLILYVLVIICFYACKAPLSSVTVATYQGTESAGRGSVDVWRCSINGKSYDIVAIKGHVIGEKYLMAYDSLHYNKFGARNPQRYEIMEFAPVFTKGEWTDTTIGIMDVCHIERKKKNPRIMFRKSDSIIVFIGYKYQVNGVRYGADTWQINDCDGTFVLPKKGDQFQVEYWHENPKRSIIHLDKPLFKTIDSAHEQTAQQAYKQYLYDKKHFVYPDSVPILKVGIIGGDFNGKFGIGGEGSFSKKFKRSQIGLGYLGYAVFTKNNAFGYVDKNPTLRFNNFLIETQYALIDKKRFTVNPSLEFGYSRANLRDNGVHYHNGFAKKRVTNFIKGAEYIKQIIFQV